MFLKQALPSINLTYLNVFNVNLGGVPLVSIVDQLWSRTVVEFHVYSPSGYLANSCFSIVNNNQLATTLKHSTRFSCR